MALGHRILKREGFEMKMTTTLWTVLLTLPAAAAEVPPPEVQIAGAVLASPAEYRDGAAVLGYNAQGEQVWIREGTNEMVCLASDPAKAAFNVACYHKDLEPFMARGRELLAQKVTGAKRNEVRFKEVEDGKLTMPREPRTLYVLTGNSFDAATGKVQDLLPALGHLHALRHAAIDGTLDEGERERALADVARHCRRAHHDQSAEEIAAAATLIAPAAPGSDRSIPRAGPESGRPAAPPPAAPPWRPGSDIASDGPIP